MNQGLTSLQLLWRSVSNDILKGHVPASGQRGTVCLQFLCLDSLQAHQNQRFLRESSILLE